MPTFIEEFWRDVDHLATTIKAATPLVGGGGLQDLVTYYEESPPMMQEQMSHRLGILVARLIQVDRALQACRSSVPS
jgi:hypothetical protein